MFCRQVTNKLIKPNKSQLHKGKRNVFLLDKVGSSQHLCSSKDVQWIRLRVYGNSPSMLFCTCQYFRHPRVSRASLLGSTSVAKDAVFALECESFHRSWWLHSRLRLNSEKFSWVSFKGFEVQSIAGVRDVALGYLPLDSQRSSHLQDLSSFRYCWPGSVSAS